MKSNDWRHKNVAPYTPGNTKILYFFNCLLDGMHTKIIYICDFSRSEATNIDYFILWRLSLPAEVRLNFMFTFAQGNFFFFERIFEDSSGDCDFRKLSGNSHIISFTRQYFFRLSSFFSHKLFTNIQYDRNIKRTKNYFFDRFFSYFPLLEPLNRRFFFSIRKVKAYMW